MITLPPELDYLSAFLMGLFGSVHCLGMCGGLASALSLQTRTGPGFYRRVFLQNLLYNSGRLLSYVLLAGLVASIGASLAQKWLSAQVVLRFVASLMLILAGIYLTGWWNGLALLERAGGAIWRRIQPVQRQIDRIPSTIRPLPLGMLWGWLPCGLVYTALTFSASQGAEARAMLTMLCFGLGTLPSMLAMGFLSRFVQQLKGKRWVSRASGLLLIFFGIVSLPDL